MSQVLSLNVGTRIETDQADTGDTGIVKLSVPGPVEVRAPGPRGVGGSGLVGDYVSDLSAHGGDDKAVYAYAREDLDDWGAELGRELASGLFGENLTTVGVDVSGALIGEHWRIGGALLRVTRPRIPCRTFAWAVGEDHWMKAFVRRAVPGAYLMVLEPGAITSGDAVTVEHRPDHDVTIALAFRALTLESELLPRLLAAADDLPAELRDRVGRRLTSDPA